MVFSTPVFLFLFLPVCLFLYYLMPKLRWSNYVLALMSLLFYGWGEPIWVFLMIFMVFVNFVAGRNIEKAKSQRAKKWILIVAVAANLACLMVFKYTGFILRNIGALLQVPMPEWKIPLPIGISFFLFQALSYVVDVYRGEVPAQKKYANLLLYISLFPQLVAGPIVRYKDINEEIERRRVTLADFAYAATRFLTGLGKKLLIADFAGEASKFFLTNEGGATVLGSWVGLIFFGFQIYFDFSAYSDMAIGLGRMFGFHFKENFNYPYTSTSITDFWRRWHISLSSFFRDYVYIPLGGNRKHQIPNLLIVWFLTGFWHGASWNFMLWGLYFGVILILEKFVFASLIEKMPVLIRRVVTLFLVLIGWGLFYFEDMSKLGGFFARAFGFAGAPIVNSMTLAKMENYLLLFVMGVIGSIPLKKWIVSRYERMLAKGGALLNTAMSFQLAYNTILLIMCTVVMISNTSSPFLYYNF